jgi:hypothetical protein
MTPQEQSMLGDLVRRIQQTQLTEKDPEAQQFLDQQLGGHPDALYVLSQTVLVQKYALEQAQKQLDALKQQASQAIQPAKPTSFLGSIFGHDKQQDAPPQQSYTPPPPSYQPVNPQYAAPQYAQPQYAAPYPPPGGYAPQSGGGSSFLRSAATTAAGVAAGALAFEGVESLMHGFGHSAGFGGGGYGEGFGGPGFGGGYGGEGFGGRPEETVINNYYDDPGRSGSGNEDRGDRDQQGLQDGTFSNARDNDLQPQLDQADDVNVGDEDGNTFDDASLDDSSSDDFGSDDSNFV